MVSVTIVQFTLFCLDLINLSECLKTEGEQFFVPLVFFCVKFQGVILYRWRRMFIVDIDFGVIKYNGGQFLLFRRQVSCVE